MSEDVSNSSEKKITINSWEVDDAMRTLTRAEEIKQNKELMELVAKKASIQKKVLDELAGRAEALYPTMKDSKQQEEK